MNRLIELKAKAYDILATIQQSQIELQKINQEMSEILKEEKNEKTQS